MALMRSGDREEKAVQQLRRHLDADHPDAVLLLARTVAGQPAATAARTVGLDAQGIEIEVDAGTGTTTVRVPFPDGTGEAPVREQLGALLLAARACEPDGTLTSLEMQIAGRPRGMHARMAARHRQAE